MSRFSSHRKLDDQTYMEIAGVDFEDFSVGQVFEHRPGRTFTAEENRRHVHRSADLTARVADDEYNARVYGGENVIAETLVVSAVTAMTTKTFNKVVANLGWTDVRLPSPVRAGDTIYAESELLGKRESKSRPAQAVLHVQTRATNQNGVEVCSFERKLLIYKRGLGPYEKAGY